MALKLDGYIDLPAHVGPGGLDHAAIHERTRRLYVAHTANDAVDVIDCARDVFLRSIEGLRGVAGVLVSEDLDCAFTSNRGEDTVGIFRPGEEDSVAKVPVGIGPNGLAFDPGRRTLLAANVGNPAIAGSFTVSIVDVVARSLRAAVPVPGRTRWTIYDGKRDRFFVNVANPARIVVLAASDSSRVDTTYEVPAAGPHGLDLDADTGRLLCACDDGQFLCLDAGTGRVVGVVPLSGPPDVIFIDSALARCYVAIGEPGVIDVIDLRKLRQLETVSTEAGAHTTALDAGRHRLYVFLPKTHRAAVFDDR
jgi:DNA-binding beta-propeller fold protein YncE